MQEKTTTSFQIDYVPLDSNLKPKVATIQRILQFAAAYQVYETTANNFVGVLLN